MWWRWGYSGFRRKCPLSCPPLHSGGPSFLHPSLQPAHGSGFCSPQSPMYLQFQGPTSSIPFNCFDLHVPIPFPWTGEFVSFNLYQESTCCPICQTPWALGNMWLWRSPTQQGFTGIPSSQNLDVFTNSKSLQIPLFGSFTEASLSKNN